MRYSLSFLLASMLVACASGAAVGGSLASERQGAPAVAPLPPSLERYRYDRHPAQLAMDSTTYDLLRRGIDTASVERVFCLKGHTVAWHADSVMVVIDSAWIPPQTGNAPNAVGGFHCPGPWAHWHLTRLGFLASPSEVDILNNLDSRTAFSVIVTERWFQAYMVDEAQILHLPLGAR